MTWKTTNITEQRQQFIAAYQRNEHPSFAALCEAFGISRDTGYATLRAYDEKGRDGLAPQSKRPHHSPSALSRETEEIILGVRESHPWWGPRKIIASLQRKMPRRSWPSPSTVGELLRRHGLSHPRPRRDRTPPFTQPLAHCVAPNDVWCTDFKGHFVVGDGSRCNPLTLTDACSRMLLRCTHVTRGDLAHTRPVFDAAFREFGLPLAMRSDNGPPFATKSLAGLSRLSVWWIRLGIWPERIDPGCPEQNGRHERMHLTLKRETATPPAANLRLQQREFDRFRAEFNDERPHEGIGQLFPADFYRPSPRHYSGVVPEMYYPEDLDVRTVREGGEIRWKGTYLFLSEVLGGERVVLWEADDGIDLYFGPLKIARIDTRKRCIVRV